MRPAEHPGVWLVIVVVTCVCIAMYQSRVKTPGGREHAVVNHAPVAAPPALSVQSIPITTYSSVEPPPSFRFEVPKFEPPKIDLSGVEMLHSAQQKFQADQEKQRQEWLSGRDRMFDALRAKGRQNVPQSAPPNPPLVSPRMGLPPFVTERQARKLLDRAVAIRSHGNQDLAARLCEQVIQQFPGTNAAAAAERQLQGMGRVKKAGQPQAKSQSAPTARPDNVQAVPLGGGGTAPEDRPVVPDRIERRRERRGFNPQAVVPAIQNRASITFSNQSGEQALVKLIGPAAAEIVVPNGGSQSVHAASGDYRFKVRYGQPGNYSYGEGERFNVVNTERQWSTVSITLHKVIVGNYNIRPISASEF